MREDNAGEPESTPSRREVLRVGLGTALFAALPGPLRWAARAHGPAEPDLRYFDAAMAAARWLRATAIESPTGASWPAVPPDAKTVQRDLYTGFPGVILFFIELYRATGDRAWLDLATKGADQLAASLPETQAGDEGAGLYSGLAGIAYTLEEADRASGESRYGAAIRKALGDIVAGARDAGAGVEWNDSTDIISGSAGTGLYLLRASTTLRDTAARDVAIRAGRRLVEREFRSGDMSFWMASSSFPRNMPNFSHGTAGVAYFLATLASETRDRSFADAAIRGAKYLQSIATPTDGDGRRIFHND